MVWGGVSMSIDSAGYRPALWRGACTAVRRTGLCWVDAVFSALTLISLTPILCVRFPQSADYLNHLTRLFILTVPADHPIHQYYTVHWHLLANLGLEAVAMPLAAFVSAETAMKIVWCLCVVGMAAGVWYLHRALFRRTQPTLLLAAPMLINLPLTVGLLNFTLGVVLLLFAVGLWLRFDPRPTARQLALFNVLSGLTLVCHVAACAALALTVGALHVFRGRHFSFFRAAVSAAGFVAPLLLLSAVVLAGHHAHPMGLSVSGIIYQASSKWGMLSAPSYTGIPAADFFGTTSTCIGIGTLLVLRLAKCHASLIPPLFVWAIVLAIMPFEIGVASYIDIRNAAVVGVLLAGSLSCPQAFWGRRRLVAMAGLAFVVVAVPIRTAIMIAQWQIHEAHIDSFRALGARIPLGAKVLVSTPDLPARRPCAKPYHWEAFDEHIPTLLTMDRAAFVSTVFADPEMQPIQPTPAVRGYAYPNVGIASWNLLSTGLQGERNPAFFAKQPKAFFYVYPMHWNRRYDYLAMRQLPCDPVFRPTPGLAFVGESQTYRLYRIVKP